jgi:hypothetical protein
MSAATQQPAGPKRLLTTVEIQQVCCAGAVRNSAVLLGCRHPRPLASEDCHEGCFALLLSQMLEENSKLIAAIVENQNLGKLDECIE